jgi:hypothetical protein
VLFTAVAAVAVNPLTTTMAEADVVTIPALADASIDQSLPNTNFGSATRLETDNSPVKRFLMRFDVSSFDGQSIASAKVRVWCVNESGKGGDLRRVTSSWSEGTVTWNTPVTFSSTVTATLGAVSAGNWYEFDVTGLLGSGSTLDLIVTPTSSNGADYDSREASSGNGPRLLVTTGTPAPDPTGTPSPSPTTPPPSPGTIPVLADATVDQSLPGTNFGAATALGTDNSPVKRFLMRFDVSSVAGQSDISVRLRVFCTNASGKGGDLRLLTSSWSESTVTWNTPVTFSSTVTATLGSVSAGNWYEFDVTGLLGSGSTLDLIVTTTSSDGADYASREASSGNGPRLVVSTGATPPPTPPPTSPPPGGPVFDVGIVGDTGYTSSQLEGFLRVRDKMNAAGLTYVLHDGDIKAGDTACTDSLYRQQRDIFNGFRAPFVLTPGDNDWTDCSSTASVKRERLAFLRTVFYPTTMTLGQTTVAVTRQANFPENVRWTHGGIVFASIHTVGSSNNRGDSTEYGPRNEANLAWMRAAFDLAVSQNARGVLIVTHANWGSPYNDTSRSGFDDVKALLEQEARDFGRPVAFVHGDTHKFRIDHPVSSAPNLLRIENYGPSSEHWIRLRIVDDSRVFVPTGE